ncbi:MAG: hypothetical protein OEL81_01570 [Nitrosopumilus sp.]|nr:hypothetical protein [Nitrosopumilus sp.]
MEKKKLKTRLLIISLIGIFVFSATPTSFAQYGGPNIPSTMTSESHPQLSPLWQQKFGTEWNEILCNPGLSLVQKYDGSPACVKPETKQKLIERGWAKNGSEINYASSYMGRITPTVEDFKKIFSEPYDIDEIFSKFGEPHDDIGSGIHIYVYELNDLTEIWIGYVDDIWYVKHVDADGNVLEDLFVKNEN